MPLTPTRLPRSFHWLNGTQFLGALNDNVFKLLLIFVLVTVAGDTPETRTRIVTTASIIFVLPFLLFSHASGVLADRVSKKRIIVFTKALEVVVMLTGCTAIVLRMPALMYTTLFLMCTQSALFGPSKYGIIPELVGESRLSRANSFLVGMSYLAIIIGTFLPSFLVDKVWPQNYIAAALCCLGIAGIGLGVSLGIETTPPAGSHKRFSPFFVLEIFRTLKGIRRDRYLFMTVWASAYFLFLGAFIQQNALLYGPLYLDLTLEQSGYLFPIAALGIGLGALLAGRLSGRNIEFGIVPVGAAILTVCCILFGVVEPSIPKVLPILLFTGIGSGLFVVPLSAFVQFQSPPQQRGEILACQNFLSFLGVAVSAGLLLLLNGVLNLSPATCFVVIGVLTGVLAIAALRTLPDFFVRFVGVMVTRVLYRLKVSGLDNIPVRGPALLVSNHVTWADSCLVSAPLQRRIRFVMARRIADAPRFAWLFRLMRVIRISPEDPPRRIVEAFKEARAALDEGYLVCIFAEGALTRNGNMLAFKPGFERIVKGTDYPIIPVYIGGGWGSLFSYFHGKLLGGLPRALPYPVTVLYGRPLPADTSVNAVRQAVIELSGRYYDLKKDPCRSLPCSFVRRTRRTWFREAMSDTTGKRLSFGKALTGAVALAGEIEAMAPGQDHIGLLLPASIGGALANMAVTLTGRVSVNLNFTAPQKSIDYAVEQCDLRTVISSRAFLEKLEGFKAPEGMVFLEDILPRITGGKKIAALLRAAFAPTRLLMTHRRPEPDDVATVIFSSGSTGLPKGVLLTHHNLISNIESYSIVFHFLPSDRLCAVLPLFHSFGFTTTLWCPLLVGFSTHYHPNPLDTARITEMIREERLTVLLTTPTFLLGYIRRAKREDLQTLRVVVTGAEKLKARVADAFEERFGIRPYEGYGTTELSPVVGAGIRDVTLDNFTQVGNKEGSIGHPIPGVSAKIVDPGTEQELPLGGEGVLLIKGPNVMPGYLNQPELTTEVLKDGWYNTGDIGRIDEDGFIYLVDRLSRFSKIGGEMVPHLAIEDQLHDALGAVHPVVAVTAAPDERKGEQLVVLYTDEAGDPKELHRLLKESGMPNLWIPRRENFVRIEELPKLGSGKLDLKQVKTMARDLLETRPSAVDRAVNRVRKAL